MAVGEEAAATIWVADMSAATGEEAAGLVVMTRLSIVGSVAACRTDHAPIDVGQETSV